MRRDDEYPGERRDEAGDADDAGVGKELGDLADAPDVLGAVRVAEAEVRVEPEAQVVAVERVRRYALAYEELLERERHRRLAGRREACAHVRRVGATWNNWTRERENENGTRRVGEQNGAQLMSLHTFCRLNTFYEYSI